MDGFDKNVQGKESNPYENIRVDPLEKDKSSKEDAYAKYKESTRPQRFAVLVSYFKKIASSIFTRDNKNGALIQEMQLIDPIRSFRNLLLLLASEDLSHNPEFTKKLSDDWHQLLQCTYLLALNVENGVSPLLARINFFIQQIENFPPGADHTLGYYFTEYAGEEWIPFPFMEILQGLHEEKREHAILGNWIDLLDEILILCGVQAD